MPHPPKIAFEVWDYAPEDWPDWAVEPYRDVINDPAAWAKKSVEKYGAEMIALLLKSADPNGMNRDVEEVVATVKAVSDAISVPLIVWGCANDEKDAALLRRVAEVCEGKNIALGPVIGEELQADRRHGHRLQPGGHRFHAHRRQPREAAQHSARQPGRAGRAGSSSTPRPAAWATASNTPTR